MAKRQRKPYRKPEVKRVRLVPEEAVLGGCKNVGTSGPPGLANCGLPSPCSAVGS